MKLLIVYLLILFLEIISLLIIRFYILQKKRNEIKILLAKKLNEKDCHKKSPCKPNWCSFVSMDGLIELWEDNKKRFRSFIEST